MLLREYASGRLMRLLGLFMKLASLANELPCITGR